MVKLGPDTETGSSKYYQYNGTMVLPWMLGTAVLLGVEWRRLGVTRLPGPGLGPRLLSCPLELDLREPGTPGNSE